MRERSAIASVYSVVVSTVARSASGPRRSSLGFVVFAGLAFLMLTAVLASADSVGKDKDDEKMLSKEVTGEVVTVTKRAISVEFAHTADAAEEMLLPITKETKVERVRSLSELRRGDTVKVAYTQYYRDVNEGGKPVVLRTVATNVALLRNAPSGGMVRSENERGSE